MSATFLALLLRIALSKEHLGTETKDTVNGLFAPPNGTALVALIVGAISVAGAVFLILELDQPFGGFIRISSRPILNAVER